MNVGSGGFIGLAHGTGGAHGCRASQLETKRGSRLQISNVLTYARQSKHMHEHILQSNLYIRKVSFTAGFGYYVFFIVIL